MINLIVNNDNRQKAYKILDLHERLSIKVNKHIYKSSTIQWILENLPLKSDQPQTSKHPVYSAIYRKKEFPIKRVE